MTKYFASLLLFLVAWPSFAADQNGYTAQYECKSGGTNCNVDVVTYTTAACAQTITTADTLSQINTKLNTGSSPICITNGDYSAKGTITLTTSGTFGARRVMRYIRASDNDDEPWNQSGANQAKMPKIEISGASYWIFHRLTWDGVDAVVINFLSSGGSVGTIFNRIYLTGITENPKSVVGAIMVREGNNGTASAPHVIQNSVARNFIPAVDVEVDFVEVHANFVWVVNNEVYNVSKGFFTQGGSSTLAQGSVVENNDIYATPAFYTDCSGNLDVNGTCMLGRTFISMKRGGTATNPVRIIHNRLWGHRKTDHTVCCTATSWHMIGTSNDSVDDPNNAPYVLVQNNILMDGEIALHSSRDGPHHNSYVGNLVYNIRDLNTGDSQTSQVFTARATQYEFYLNTIISSETWLKFVGAATDHDLRCNVLIADGTKSGTPGSGTQVDYNVFYGTTLYTVGGVPSNIDKSLKLKSTYSGCTSPGCTATEDTTGLSIGDIVRTSSTPVTDCTSNDKHCYLYKVNTVGTSGQIQAVRGPYSFYRKLKTRTEQVFIPYARPYSSAPEATSCPGNYAARTGIGIANE